MHHIDYDKDQGCGKNFNLIPLCQANHIRTNFNRSFWEKLFIYSLEIDKWYYEIDPTPSNVWNLRSNLTLTNRM